MSLSSDLIAQFVKVTKPTTTKNQQTTVYGKAYVEQSGDIKVLLDGSDTPTPAITTAEIQNGERVTVLMKDHRAIITGNIDSPAPHTQRIDGLADDLVEYKNLSVQNLEAAHARIDDLDVRIFKSKYANIGQLIAEDATIASLKAKDAEIETLVSDTIHAINIYCETLESDIGDIKTLIFGSATGDTIQTSFSNSVVAQLGDAQIKSAMIDSISASKITAGDIVTNNVRVMSEDGRLLIADETLQISDASRVRVQIGKDAANDYSINVWDQNGNLMFSKGGITDSAIKEAIIRNDMVSDTANIAAHKLDIDSLFDEINGSSKTIKSSKVFLDEDNQTLDLSFKALTTDISNLSNSVSSQGTAISVIQGQITSKIWQQDINEAAGEMYTRYSTLEAELNGFRTAVSESYAQKSALTTVESTIEQMSDRITDTVSETTSLGTRVTAFERTASGLTLRLDEQSFGGTNILRASNTVSALGSSSSWSNSTWRSAGSGTGTRTVIDITDAPNIAIKKGFQLISDDSDTTTCQDNIPVSVGSAYTVSCYARGTGTLRLQVGKSPYTAKTFGFDGETKWTKCSMTFVAGDGNGVTNNKTNVYFGNRGVGTLEVCGFKMEIGNTASDWSPSPFDVDGDISSASKTATNYMSATTSGLVVGDMTKSTLGNNVLIDSDSVDIRNGTTALASFGASYLYLAKNSRNATIDLCNGLAKLYHQSKYSYDTLFIIDTPNATEIQGTYNPLCVTSTVSGKVAIQFANTSGVLGSIGMVESGTESYITRNHPSTAATYSILDTGNFYKIMDSGWINCTLNTGAFTRYNNDIPQPQVRKIGKQVYLRGEAKPVVAVTPASDSDTVIATIPSGYRPSERQQFIMQGSGAYRWMMSIHTDGRIAISRYTNSTTANMNIAAGAWLCCHAQWTID